MKMNINDLYDQFCQEARLIKNFSPATIRWYRGVFKAFMRHYDGQIQDVAQIDTELLRQYLFASVTMLQSQIVKHPLG